MPRVKPKDLKKGNRYMVRAETHAGLVIFTSELLAINEHPEGSIEDGWIDNLIFSNGVHLTRNLSRVRFFSHG